MSSNFFIADIFFFHSTRVIFFQNLLILYAEEDPEFSTLIYRPKKMDSLVLLFLSTFLIL